MIDLHLHTIASDGALNAAELLQKCEALGLEMISITDHYAMESYRDLKDPAVRKLFSGEILPGCEFSAHFKGINIEVLGYGIDPDAAQDYIKRVYPTLAQKREKELNVLIALYREKGYPFDEAAVRTNFSIVSDAREAMRLELNKYPENIARYYDPASETSFKCFMRREVGNPKSCYFLSCEAFFPSAQEVCSQIRAMGGKAIIAHPGCYNSIIYDSLEELIETAKPDGLEAWYSTHTPEQREHLLSLCQKYNLIYSGGSDYHNDLREAAGNVLGMPQLAEIFPLAEMRKWIDPLKKI